jgi:hypothetical protein
MKKLYSIAGLKVELRGGKTIQLISELPGFDVFEINDKDTKEADIHIHTDMDINTKSLTNIRHIHYFVVLDTKHSFSICKEGYLYEMCRLNGSKIISIIYDPHRSNVIMSSPQYNTYIKYAMWVAYVLPAVEKKVLPIHASSVVKNSEAILFLGESGTGKSTHSRLWLQYIEDSYLLNDDSPLLRIEDDKISVYGSPWSGKTHCYRQDMIPLKAIVRLSQYPKNCMNRANKLASIGAVHPSFPPFLAYDEQFSEKMIRIIDKIINDIPVYGLMCCPNKQAAEVAYAAIY